MKTSNIYKKLQSGPVFCQHIRMTTSYRHTPQEIAKIRAEFGDAVARAVEECDESWGADLPPLPPEQARRMRDNIMFRIMWIKELEAQGIYVEPACKVS